MTQQPLVNVVLALTLFADVRIGLAVDDADDRDGVLVLKIIVLDGYAVPVLEAQRLVVPDVAVFLHERRHVLVVADDDLVFLDQ